MTEFIPADRVRRAANKLRSLAQTPTVPKYFWEFSNIFLTIPDMNEGEKVDRTRIWIEVLNTCKGA